MDYTVNYISKVAIPDNDKREQYHRSAIIIHRGNGYYLAEFDEQKQLDEFASMMGFTYTKRKESYSHRFGIYQEFDISHRFAEGNAFKSLDQLPDGAKPFKALSNGSIVTCYFVNDGEAITIYRPNPNAKAVYEPMNIWDHIRHCARYGTY